MLAPLIANNLNQIRTLCHQHGVQKLYAFGSAVSNTFNAESDIDLLVEFEEIDTENYSTNYFNFIEKLEKLLCREIDLVTAKFLKNRIFIKRLNRTKEMLFAA